VASYAITNNAEVGVSSLVTAAAADVESLLPRVRQAHGAWTRYAPAEKLGFLAEANLLASESDGTSSIGSVGYLQVDYEPVQGFHARATGEWCDPDQADTLDASLRASGTLLWFFGPHLDLRGDVLYGTLYCTPGTEPSPMALVQLHGYL
jgi:hypothetical protein